jgi:hypothetical protein
MTYAASTVAYWVGQANDASTGTHPTGWTTGQRWSETASEWQAMYDGVSASLTAMTTDRNTWTTRANQAWGPSRVWNSGSSYETLYNDMSSQKSTWESRANQAWGPNRVWNNGSSWEALYNDMVVQRDAWITNYNNMVANRDYWMGQANYYWGPSRAHGSGSTWEQLYNASYCGGAGGDTPYACTGYFGSSGGSTITNFGNNIPGFANTKSTGPNYTFSVGKNGWYTIFMQSVCGPGTNGFYNRIDTTRGAVQSNPVNATGGTGTDSGTGCYFQGFLYNGDGITMQSHNSSGPTNPYTWTNQNDFKIIYVPTPNNPH